eukprot:324465-Hanusia_phi.AAC.1
MGNRTTHRPAMPPGAGFNARGELNRIESSQISFDQHCSTSTRYGTAGRRLGLPGGGGPKALRLWPGGRQTRPELPGRVRR